MKLSYAVARLPAGSAGIRLVNAGICEIDTLPQHYQGVKVLLLSQNKISTLAGLVYFYQLEKLSLSQNLLDSFDELTYLQPLYNLKQLRLDGNPIAYHPSYKCRVLDAISSIVELDGVAVSQNDRLQAYALLTQMLYKEQLVLEDISQILQLRQYNADPERVLYEKVQKQRIQRSRQTTWQTIYDAVAMQVQNELAGLLSNFELSYRQSLVLGAYSGRVDQTGFNFKNSTPRKRISSSQLSEMTRKYASSPEATVKSIVHQAALPGQNYLFDGYNQTSGSQNVISDSESAMYMQNQEMQRMRQQMDTLRAQLLEYQKANAENVELSVNQIHELKHYNEQLYTTVETLYRANAVYYYSVVEKQRQVDSTESKTAALQRDLQQTAATLQTTQLKQKALESDCKNLAREVLKQQRAQRAVNTLQMTFKRRYLANLRNNCYIEHRLRGIEEQLTSAMRRRAGTQCLRFMRALAHLKALFYAFRTAAERRKLSAGLNVWRKANKIAGFKPSGLKAADDAKGAAVHSNLYVKRPFDCWLGLLKQNQFKAKLLGQKCGQFQRALQQKQAKRLFCALAYRARLTSRNALIIGKNAYRALKRSAMTAILEALGVRRRVAEIGTNLACLLVQEGYFAAFRAWKALSYYINAEKRITNRNCYYAARRAFYALKEQFFTCSSRRRLLAVAALAARSAERASCIIVQKAAFLALCGRKQALERAEQKFAARTGLRNYNFAGFSTIMCYKQQRLAFDAFKTLFRSKARAGSVVYQYSKDSAEAALTSKETAHLYQQLSVYYQEVQKFYALAQVSKSESAQLRNALAAAQVENQRLRKLSERLGAQMYAVKASAYNYQEELEITAENERLQLYNAQLRAGTADLYTELYTLRRTLSSVGGGQSFDAVFYRLKDAEQDLSAQKRSTAALELLLMQRTAERDAAARGLLAAGAVGAASAGESLEAAFEQAKILNSELQERLRISEAERRLLIQQIAAGASNNGTFGAFNNEVENQRIQPGKDSESLSKDGFIGDSSTNGQAAALADQMVRQFL